MRDRLIELKTQFVENFDCGDCKPDNVKCRKCLTEKEADYLLANGVIVPPCKVGDTVYYLTTEDTEKELNVTDIFCGTVQGLGFDGTNIWISAKYTNGLFYYHKSTDFGKTVFITKEEAEKALAERSRI